MKNYFDNILIFYLYSSIEQPQRIVIAKKPPGPPPGRPPILSDNEDISDDEEGNCYEFKFYIIVLTLETSLILKPSQSNGKLIKKTIFSHKISSFFLKERRRIRFADPSSSLPSTASVSRWSDNIPNEEAEFGTPVTISQPPQYNTVSSYLIHLFLAYALFTLEVMVAQ